jgi:hypothetical protein
MEKVNGKYILEGEFVRFDTVNRNGSRFYYTDIDWYEMQKSFKRIIKINKIWKKDTH